MKFLPLKEVSQRKTSENTIVALLLLTGIIVFCLFVIVQNAKADTNVLVKSHTVVNQGIADYCVRARLDANNLDSEHIPNDYGPNLTNLCGAL